MRGGKGRGDCGDRRKSNLQITMRVHECRRNRVERVAGGAGGTSLSMISRKVKRTMRLLLLLASCLRFGWKALATSGELNGGAKLRVCTFGLGACVERSASMLNPSSLNVVQHKTADLNCFDVFNC